MAFGFNSRVFSGFQALLFRGVESPEALYGWSELDD